ncbi:MAG: biotin transporter BioY [Actinobacteria bacterium]|nr:biotin transporter BioY [Actinomycetota bacterium]
MEIASVFESRVNKAFLYIFMPLTFAALTYLGSQASIYLPFTPVPITLQVLTVILAGLTLGPRLGALSQAEYVIAGILGAPVFAGGKSGVVALAGPTGGYLVGFIFAAFVIGTVYRVYRRRDDWGIFLSAATGVITIYIFGATWLAILFVLSGLGIFESIGKSMMLGVVPFIGADVLKIIVAAALVKTIVSGSWRDKVSRPR